MLEFILNYGDKICIALSVLLLVALVIVEIRKEQLVSAGNLKKAIFYTYISQHLLASLIIMLVLFMIWLCII